MLGSNLLSGARHRLRAAVHMLPAAQGRLWPDHIVERAVADGGPARLRLPVGRDLLPAAAGAGPARLKPRMRTDDLCLRRVASGPLRRGAADAAARAPGARDRGARGRQDRAACELRIVAADILARDRLLGFVAGQRLIFEQRRRRAGAARRDCRSAPCARCASPSSIRRRTSCRSAGRSPRTHSGCATREWPRNTSS